MTARLIFAIISTILEEVAIVVIALWGLPEIGIILPVWAIILIMLAWLSYSVYTFRKGTQALKSEQIVGLPTMIGTRGTVISPLTPDGLVRIRGELWIAKSTSGDIEVGGKVIVVGQDRLKLEVSDADDSGGTETAD